MTEPAIRASDADRDHVAEQLAAHYAAGRLDTGEYEERLAAAYAARSWSELRSVLADLPAETSADEPTTASVDPCLLICLLIACPPAGFIYWLIARRTARRRAPQVRRYF